MLIIFDLDGTLIDSAKDLAISMNATREHLGMAPLDPALIYSFVGNGAPMLVRRALGPGASEQLVQDGLSFFMKYYRMHALEHTQLYPGVRELLDALAGNHTLAILTNKPVKISFDIVAALGLVPHFQRVYGGDSFAEKKPDPVGILTLMTETATTAQNTWMVGDSSVDVQTARNAGVRSCGVAWGFQPESLETIRPDMLIHSPGEMLPLLN
ncbi:MAG TPA: HAD-IA family hydrolase [Bryobacteraceae bacterium]|nr:HAD-IA family hydrolase [Bryobacteraceae bacterium]